MRGRGSKGTRSCNLRDPRPTPPASVGARSGGEAGVGRKKTLLLGWLTRGIRLAAGAAQACRDAVKRYGLAGGTRRSASARARVARRSWVGFVGCVREWEGRRAGSQGQAGLDCCFSLFFPFSVFYSFSILFSFLFYLLPICLGFDVFSLIIIVTIPSFWFGQEFRVYMWSPHT